MKTQGFVGDQHAHERILADAMVDVASELRLADPGELLTMIRTDQEANIADLVNSSSELFFKAGSLRYGLAAKCDLGWSRPPSVSLDMEFRHEAVTVFFRLVIGRACAGIEVIDLFIDNGEPTEAAFSSVRLARAIAEARSF